MLLLLLLLLLLRFVTPSCRPNLCHATAGLELQALAR
jgi:hypothetical protein